MTILYRKGFYILNILSDFILVGPFLKLFDFPKGFCKEEQLKDFICTH